ncbi:hypothetical protein WMY93_024443 [Mugilogobius chulae]|uniref:BRISC and BRCA1-A complex member 1 n=1 Tax=Mugilogobius chulae TaxID=88201 RepID=A0AAW0N315_9GOBI
MVELRPRTRSNPEGAEDRRGSTSSLGGNSNDSSVPQPAVGSRVEGEGEASTSDSPPSSTTASVSVTVAPTVPPAAAVAGPSAAAGAVSASNAAAAAAVVKERPKPTQSQPALNSNIPPPIQNQALNISQKMIEMFVRTKHKIDKRHEFALVELCSCLYDLETNVCESFNLEDLLNVIRQKIDLPLTENVQTVPPPYVIRTVLIYSRQAGPLQFNPSESVSKMLQSPYFFFDVVYLHNGMDEQGDDTSWRENYTSFCNLDSKGLCYRYEVSLCGPAIELHNCMAKLLSHPLQRPFQSHASYSLLEGDDIQDLEATV